MVVAKPHSVTFTAKSGAVEGKELVRWSDAGTRAVAGMMAPLSGNRAYDDTGVLLDRPHLLICETADGDAFQVGDEAAWNGDGFVVRRIETFRGIGLAAHSEIILEGKHGLAGRGGQ